MAHHKKLPKPSNYFSLFFFILLIVGLGILLMALTNSTELRQFAVYLPSYPNSYPPPDNDLSPECTIAAFADNSASNPPNYIITTQISTVSPNQQFVIATNFFNNTNKNYEQASNHITLGKYLAFVDSNGDACNLDENSKTIKCDHGYFQNGGATSMAFRVKYIGQTAAPLSIFGTTFTSNGDTGSCMTSVNDIPVLP